MLTGGGKKATKKEGKKTDSDKENKDNKDNKENKERKIKSVKGKTSKESKSVKKEEPKKEEPEVPKESLEPPTGQVVKIDDLETYNRYKAKGLVVIDYYTTWCTPCRLFAPEFEEIAKRYPGTIFLSVNVEKVEHDDCNNITSVPHFKILLNGVVKREFSGVDPDRLTRYIERYYVQIYINGHIQRSMDKDTKQKIINYVNSLSEPGDEEEEA